MMTQILLLTVMLVAQSAQTSQATAPRPGARVTEFSWLTGTWVGEGLGGEVEEVWSSPVGGSMVGHFRLVRDGKPVFYELLTLIEVEGSVEMRLKHMNPDMTGWEEKNDFVTFKLVKHDTSGAYFGPFTIQRTGPNSWEGFLAMTQGGVTREEKFVFRRK